MRVKFPGALLSLEEAGSLYRNRFWFVPVPRTGSTTINNELKREFGPFHSHQGTVRYHRTAQDYQAMFGNEVWEQMFTFGFIRNPWDRMVSWFGYRHPEQTRDSFAEFVRGPHPKHFRFNCIDYLLDADGVCIVGYVAQFEHLQENFDRICDQIKMPRNKLSKQNFTRRKHYTLYYDEGLKNYIYHKCRKDIEYFGYKFSASE